jgi:mycothiol synthase
VETESLAIFPCPPRRREEALALVLCDLAPSQRREIASGLYNSAAGANSAHGLYVAVRGERLCGAVWGQPQPGKTAVLWPPQLTPGEGEDTAYRLAEAAVRVLDSLDVSMAQVLLLPGDDAHVAVITSMGFQRLADLLYLSCEADRFNATTPPQSELEFVPYEDSRRAQLAQVVEHTYENTLDCAALNGVRSMADVLDGYRATGTFRTENWLIVCSAGHDVGVLLLADHAQAKHWELMYMGLVPAARGRGWGREIVLHAQRLAHRAGAERIVLAVDSVNEPALALYRALGFEAWDRRAVYVRVRR